MISAHDRLPSLLRHAVSAYGDHFGDTRLLPLAIALVLHLFSLLIRSGVWCGILRAAFPDREVKLRPTVWAYLAGAGANAIAPLRGGDLVRISAIRRHLPGASLATIISTLVAETVFGVVMVVAMATATVSLGCCRRWCGCPTVRPSSSRSTPATPPP